MSELYLFKDGNDYLGFKPGVFALGNTTFEGRQYVPTIIARSGINITDNFSKSPVAFKFERTHTFARRILNTMPEVPILVTIYRNSLPYWKGKVMKAKANGAFIEVFCDSIFAAQIKSGHNITISPQCWHVLYSPQCGVLESSWRSVYTSATITGVEVDIPSMTKPEGYFVNGKIVISGQTRHILQHIGTTLTLSNTFTGPVSGDIWVYPGCDLSEKNCIAFNNLVNYIGFARISPKNPFGSTGLL